MVIVRETVMNTVWRKKEGSLEIHNFFLFFFFNDTATTEIYTLSLHDALPILYQLLLPTVKKLYPL